MSSTSNGYQATTTNISSLSSRASPEPTTVFYRKRTNFCKLCDPVCSQCFGYTDLKCTMCINTHYLIDNNALCNGIFSGESDTQVCLNDKRCINTCPSNLYFPFVQSRTSNSLYPYTATDVPSMTGLPSYIDNIYRRKTNLCYLCHRYCLTCTDQYDYTCSNCTKTFFKWIPNSDAKYVARCNYYCMEGHFSNAINGIYLPGQFIKYLSYNIADRNCGVCDNGCQFCSASSDNCYMCWDTHFLMDDKATC